MGDIVDFFEIREKKRLESLEQLRAHFIEEVTPGSVVHLSLDGKIYWDTRTGQVVEEAEFPYNWPLEDFVGWLLHTFDEEIGPKLSPFSVYLSDGNRHSGIGFTFPWNHIKGYVAHYKSRELFDDSG